MVHGVYGATVLLSNPLMGHRWTQSLLRCLVVGVLATSAQATELKTNTAAAFDRYTRTTETQRADDLHNGRFFVLDSLPEPARRESYAQLRQGQLYIEQLHLKENGHSIPIPGGLVHHWVGVMFVPGATLSQVISVLRD